MALNLGDAFVNIRPQMATFEKALNTGLTSAFEGAAGVLADSFKKIGGIAIKRFAIPLGVAITANISQFQALDAKIRETLTLFDTAPGQVEKPFKEMQDGIFEVSSELGVLEQGISEGLYQAISAGVPRDNVFEFLETAQKAAIGGGIDLVTSIDGITTAVNAFAAQGLSAEAAADILFAGVAEGKTTFDQLSVSMAKVAPAVAASGASFEEMIALASQMTKLGTPTAEAFTNIRAAMTGLLKPSDEMKEIWEEAGFASAELAIQTLGLQGAMEVVRDATGGNQTELIKLLGGFEAMNAVLQVTGDNAESFAGVLDSTSNAAGRMNNAFEVMQGGTGRAFGSLTAAFDRLGNASGQLAADFVVPLVRALTGAIDLFARWVRRIREAIQPIVKAWQAFVNVIIDNPVFDVLVAAIGTLVGALTILGAVLGTTVGGIGLLLGAILQFRQIRLITGLIQANAAAFSVLGRSLGRIVEGVGTLFPRFGKLASASSKAGSKITSFFSALKPGPMLAVTAAITAGVIAYQKISAMQDRWRESAMEMTRGADELADSLGLVTNKIGDLQIPDLGGGDTQMTIGFRVQNIDLIERIERITDELGIEAGQDALYDLVVRWIQQGNTPEEAIAAVKRFADEAGLDIPLDFLDEFEIDATRAFSNVLNDMRLISQEANNMSTFIGDPRIGNVFDIWDKGATKLEGSIADAALRAAELFAATNFDEAGLDSFIGNMEAVEAIIGDNEAVANQFFDDLIKGIEEVNGTELGVSLKNTEDLDTFLMELRNVGIISDEIWASWQSGAWQASDEVVEAVEAVADAPWDISQLTEDQAKSFETLSERMQSAFETADETVKRATDSIRESILAQQPLLDTYAGALEQPFNEWKKGQDAFQADLELWVERSGEIMGSLPDDVRRRLEEEPISTKVWLANLGDEQLKIALGELEESYNLATAVAEEELKQRLPEVIDEAAGELRSKYADMESDARDMGEAVAEGFRITFAAKASSWATAAASAASAATSAARNSFGIQSPSKVFMEIAANVAEGFSMGIERNRRLFDVVSRMPRIDMDQFERPQRPGFSTTRGEQAARTIHKVVNMTFNNPTVQDADEDAIKAAVMDRLAGLV